MTTTALQQEAQGVVPEWELCDRMRRSMRLVGSNMDNSDVAELMGVRRETVSTWLNGRRRPSYAVLRLWADMTGVNLTWLVEGVTEDKLYAMRDLNPQPADSESLGPWNVCGLCGRRHGLGTCRPVLRLLGGPRIVRPVPVKPRLTLVGSVA